MKNIKLYFILYFFSAVVLRLSRYVLLFYVAHKLTIYEYSKFGLLYSLQVGIASFSISGLIETTIGMLRDYKRREIYLFSAINTLFILNSLVITAIISCSYFLLYHTDLNFTIILIVLFAGFALSFSNLQSNIVRLREEHLKALYFSFFVPFLGHIGSFVSLLLANSNNNIMAFFVGGLLFSLMGLILSMLLNIGILNFVWNLKDIKRFFIQIIPYAIVAFLGWLNGYGNNYIIGLFFNNQEIAKFTFLFTLSSILNLILTSLNQVWSPRFYNIVYKEKHDVVEDKNFVFFTWQGILLGIVGGIMLLLLPLAGKYTGGYISYYSKFRLELFLLLTGYIIAIPWWHISNYMYVFKKAKLIMKINIYTGIINSLLLVLFIYYFGVIGIYLNFMVRNLILVALAINIASKYWKLKYAWIGILIGLSFLLISLMLKIE